MTKKKQLPVTKSNHVSNAHTKSSKHRTKIEKKRSDSVHNSSTLLGNYSTSYWVLVVILGRPTYT